MDKNYKTVKSPKILKKIFDLYITQDFSLTSQLDGYSFWYAYQYGIVWAYKTDATAQEISEYIMNNTTYSGDPLTKEVVWINISI